jgi:7,8-dihydropterin-6-yl-methyl-4-(beta-D-ribofuranosyl)aminobenzene 5'-phosphate synthase
MLKMKCEKALSFGGTFIFLVVFIVGSAACATGKTCETGDSMPENHDSTVAPLMSKLEMRILFDNNPYEKGLKVSWGFSCLIKGTEKTILFDTGGDGSVLMANIEKMGIDPSEIDLVVLSHDHWDHTGGLSAFLEKNNSVPVYLLGSFSDDTKNNVKAHDVELKEISASTGICKNVYSTGEMRNRIEEQALVIRTTKGCVVITGCAHPGIVQIVEKGKEITGDEILFVMGGFHLIDKSRKELESVVSDFRELGVRYAAPTHCSGDGAREIFKETYKENYIEVGVGRSITLEDLK